MSAGERADTVDMVDLDELVLLEVDAVRARGKVTVDLSGFTAVRLQGRTEQLRRMIRNLLDNAERHAERTVTVELAGAGPSAELVVADDGAGIPPADRERVFDRFFRLQQARDRDSGGTGLGLAIVREVVTAHGGEVWVADSAAGAEFHVRLPVTPADAADAAEAAKAADGTAGDSEAAAGTAGDAELTGQVEPS
jgi:signal transduction histidine kinase